MLKALAPRIRALAGRVRGSVAVALEDIDSGETLAIGSRAALPLASVTKVPLMITLYRMEARGEIYLRSRMPVTDADKSLGSGLLHVFDAGLVPTLRDLIVLAEDVSDNSATDMLYRVASPEQVTREMHSLGLRISVTRSIDGLLRNFLEQASPQIAALPHHELRAFERESASPWNALTPKIEFDIAKRIFAGGNDCAPACDVTRLWAMLARGEVADAARTADMLSILYAQQHRSRLPSALPDHVKMACKPGTFPGKVVNDSAIIERAGRRVAVTMLTFYRRDYQPIIEVASVMGRIGRLVYDRLSERRRRQS